MGKGELTSGAFLINIILMKKVRDFYNAYKKNCYLAAGLLLSCLFMVPFRVFDSYIKEKSSQAASGLDFFVNLIVALYSIMWYYMDISYIEVVL